MEVLRLNQDQKLSVDQVLQIFEITENYLFRRNICEVPRLENYGTIEAKDVYTHLDTVHTALNVVRKNGGNKRKRK